MIPAAGHRYRRERDSVRGSAAFGASEELPCARRPRPHRRTRGDLSYIAGMKPTPPLPPGVLEAFQRGRTLEALKLLRQSGFGLKEAKRLLEWHARQNTIPTRARPVEDLQEPRASQPPPRPMAHTSPAPQPTMASVSKRLSPGEVPRGPGNALGVGVVLVVGILAALYFLGAG
jgi:hypothetical protein